jgi:hypothetical protein
LAHLERIGFAEGDGPQIRAASDLITARSASGSLPTIVASAFLPSVRRIESVPPPAATLIT